MAIVGARQHTTYGMEVAHDAAYMLAQRGVVVVSGLAYGIDAVAHRAAIEAGGVTVAVLGTAIDQIYPRRHVGLAREIVSGGGAIISEYGPGAPFYKANFLARNRLIAGLADVVLVVEAGARSGSLNTAAHALEQGKTVYAVPGDVTRPTSVGCNRLLAQGANVYTDVNDIMLELFSAEYLAKANEGTTRQLRLFESEASGASWLEQTILSLLVEGVRDGDELLARVRALKENISTAEFHSALTLLELKGQIWALGMNRWGLK